MRNVLRSVRMLPWTAAGAAPLSGVASGGLVGWNGAPLCAGALENPISAQVRGHRLRVSNWSTAADASFGAPLTQ